MLVQVRVVRLDGKLSAARHRISRVDDEIHENLLDLAWDSFHLPQASRGEKSHLDVRVPSRRPIILSILCDDRVEIENLFGSNTCCRLNARSWRVRSAARSPAFPDLFEVRAQQVVAFQIREDQARVAQHDGEHVVEVVRHPARQPADGIHLLRVAKLLFGSGERCGRALLPTDVERQDARRPRVRE